MLGARAARPLRAKGATFQSVQDDAMKNSLDFKLQSASDQEISTTCMSRWIKDSSRPR
jgi:hypothetical protein